MSVSESQYNAKPHRDADPPYASCAAGIFSHCGPDRSYCSVMLNVEATRAGRQKNPDTCCYGKR